MFEELKFSDLKANSRERVSERETRLQRNITDIISYCCAWIYISSGKKYFISFTFNPIQVE